MSDFGNNLPQRFPSVGTNEVQQGFVYGRLLPAMVEEGLIEDDSYAEFSRWAIVEASKRVGLEPVSVIRKAPGRKPKQRIKG